MYSRITGYMYVIINCIIFDHKLCAVVCSYHQISGSWFKVL